MAEAQARQLLEDESSKLISQKNDIEQQQNHEDNVEVEELFTKIFHHHISDYVKGVMVLMTVPLLWGTFAPILKILQRLKPEEMPPFLFSQVYHILGAIPMTYFGIQEYRVSLRKDVPWFEGIEIAFYAFIGTSSGILALQVDKMPIDRSVFEIQLQNLIVPLLQVSPLFRDHFGSISPKFWIGATAVTLGIIMLVLDDSPHNATTASPSENDGGVTKELFNIPFGLGDVLSINSAFFYSLYGIRTGQVAQRVPHFLLCAVQVWAFILLTMTIVVYQAKTYRPFCNRLLEGGFDFSGYFIIVASVLWTVFSSGSYSYWANVYGQQYVAPSHATLIRSSTPIWASLFAYIFLRESMGWLGVLGAMLIILGLGYNILFIKSSVRRQ